MKKIFLALLLIAGLLTTLSTTAQACDKGCTMGGSYMGILPQFNQHFVGLRYTTRYYTLTTSHTHLMDNGMPHTHTESTREQYSSLEAWGRFYLTPRIQLMAFVPYVINSQQKPGSNLLQQGMGDISLLANYSLLNTGDSASHNIRYTLLVGGGIKLPTGSATIQHNEALLPANLQPGTGSVDMLLTAQYTIRYRQTGLSTDFTYRFNGQGHNSYQFGNRYNGSANLFYWHKTGSISLLPNAGLYYERAQADSYHDHHNMQGGGSALFTNLGLNVYYRSLALGASSQLPLSQQNQQHITAAKHRMQLSLSMMF